MEINNKPLVSVLVAVYNVEKYLSKCLNSIINQTYRNLEIIIIDDGSTDSSLCICKDFEKKDDRITVISQKNKGLSSARNVGLDNANGDFVYMTDSDDYILKTMISTLIELLLEKNADIAVCDNFVNQQDNMIINNEIHIKNNKEVLPDLLIDKINSQVWNKIFAKKVIGAIRFQDNMIAQDLGVMHLFFENANTIVFTNEKLYLYFANRGDNISNINLFTVNGSYHRAIHFENRYKFAIDKYPGVSDILLKYSLHFYLSAFFKSMILKEDEKSLLIHGELVKLKRKIFSSKINPFYRIVSYFVINKRKFALIIIEKLLVLIVKFRAVLKKNS